MENTSSTQLDSPVKNVRKGEYKVQFADASEQYKSRTPLSGKPPEFPRSSTSSLKLRNSGSASSSISNLSNSVGSKLNKGNSNTPSSFKNDSFGSTTSLDRRRHVSSKNSSHERTLQPISDAKRTQSLDRRKLEQSLSESSSSLTLPNYAKKKRDSSSSYERRYKSRSPYSPTVVNNGAQLSEGYSAERTKYRPKTSHAALSPMEHHSPFSLAKPDTLVESNSRHNNFLQKVKRASSKSPHRKSNNKFSFRDDEKENEKSKERSSRSDERRHDRERGRSLKREACRTAPADYLSNDNLEELWSFEPGVMWSRTLNNRRIGYLLFSCNNLDTPRHDTYAAKFNMTFKFSPQAESKLIRLVLEAHGFTEVSNSSTQFNMYWSNTHFNPNEIRLLQDWQKLNHFPRSSELTRKDRLYMNIKRMQRQFGVKLFDFIPTSFVLPVEYREFCETHLRERGTWIVKPVASSQGKGIYLISQIDQVSAEETSLISRYIDSPLLVDGYKCDLRLYVAVTSLDPLIVYMYEEGLVRLATVKYQQKKNLWNPCIHLTNYSVNKFHSNYQHNQDPEIDNQGSKWSLSAFLKYLRCRGVDTATVMRNIEDVIIKSLFAAAYQMNTATSMFVPHARNCFELYGFDILIDEQYKPWVLEVNLSPSLNIDQPLDLKIKSSMLSDLFSLAGLLICNPATTRMTSRPSFYRKLPNLRYSTESYERHTRGSSTPVASVEELKLVRQVMEEYERRGGWARIFPTPDSWAAYSGLQEYDSPMNLVLHTHLYPHVQRNTRLRVARCSSLSSSSSGLASSLERLTCYERPLPKGLAFIKDKLGLGKSKEDRCSSQVDAQEVKQNLLEALENGLKLSKYQARMAFSVYLQHVQRRLMIGCDQENQTDLVYRFLRSATRTLHLPLSVQSPSRNLPEEARAVVISKQLGDFIMAYTKETQTRYVTPPPSMSPDAPPSDESEHSNTAQTQLNDAPSSDKSVRFNTTVNCTEGSSQRGAEKPMCRYPSNYSFNDVTPSDVPDPLDQLIMDQPNNLLQPPPHTASSGSLNTTSSGASSYTTPSTYPHCSLSGEQYTESSMSGNTQHTSVPHTTQHTSVSHTTQHTSVPHTTQHTSVPHTTQHTSVPHTTQHTSVPHTTQHTFVPHTTQHTSIPHTTQHTSVPHTTQHTAVPHTATLDAPLNTVMSSSSSLSTTSDLSASLMTASNDSFSSFSTSGISGSVISSSSLSNSFSSASIPLTESSSAASLPEDHASSSSSTSSPSTNTVTTVVAPPERSHSVQQSCFAAQSKPPIKSPLKTKKPCHAYAAVSSGAVVHTQPLTGKSSLLSPVNPTKNFPSSDTDSTSSKDSSYPLLCSRTLMSSFDKKLSSTFSNIRRAAAVTRSTSFPSNSCDVSPTFITSNNNNIDRSNIKHCSSTDSQQHNYSSAQSCTTTAAQHRAPLRKMKSLDAGYSSRDGADGGGGSEEDDAMMVTGGGDTVAMELYRAFMSAAREADLEEVLALQTRLHNSAGMFLDSARRSITNTSSSSTRQGSRPRTPTASPHGSPRRGRRSPSIHGSHSKLGGDAVTSEPATAAAPPPHNISDQPPEGASKQSSSCCLFGNILKASLKGTNTSFSV